MPAGCGGALAVCAIALAATHVTHLQTSEGNSQLVFGELLVMADKSPCCWWSPTATRLIHNVRTGGSTVEYSN